MKQHGIFNQAFSTIIFSAVFFILFSFSFAEAQQSCAPSSTPLCPGQATGQCGDGIDNDCDGRADYCGLDPDGDGIPEVEPDPACFSPNSTVEYKDDVVSEIIPCTDKCTFNDVFKLLNNLMTFFIRVILIPIFIIILMYTGYKYITAQGNPVKIASIKQTFKHLIGGILLILCAWLIVVTLLRTVGYTDDLIFFNTTQ